jgi:hypothetical protein
LSAYRYFSIHRKESQLWQDKVNVDLLPWVHKNNEKLPAGVDRRLIKREQRTSLRLRRPELQDIEAGRPSVVIGSICLRSAGEEARVRGGGQPKGARHNPPMGEMVAVEFRE